MPAPTKKEAIRQGRRGPAASAYSPEKGCTRVAARMNTVKVRPSCSRDQPSCRFMVKANRNQEYW